MNLPSPASDSWGEWLDVLTPAQLRAVHAWRRATPYRQMLSPRTCWYQLCGRRNPAERARREALSEEHLTKQRHESAVRREKGKAVFATQEEILGGSAMYQDNPLQNVGEGPQIAKEAA